jgi:hypothetical protein
MDGSCHVGDPLDAAAAKRFPDLFNGYLPGRRSVPADDLQSGGRDDGKVKGGPRNVIRAPLELDSGG